MLRWANQSVIEAEISSINCSRFFNASLLEQQCTQRVTRWLHPNPRFGVIQAVVQPHTILEFVKRQIKVAESVFKLASEHSLANFEYVTTFVVKEQPISRAAIHRGKE